MSTQDTGSVSIDPFQTNQQELNKQYFDECMASVSFSDQEVREGSSQEQAMFQLDADFMFAQGIRKQLVSRLLPSVMSADMQINSQTDPDLIQAKNRQFSEMRGLLSDIESSNKNRVGMKLKQKDTELQEQQTINAADFLRNIKISEVILTTQAGTPETIDTQLEDQFNARGCTILDTELEAAGNMLPEEKSENDF